MADSPPNAKRHKWAVSYAPRTRSAPGSDRPLPRLNPAGADANSDRGVWTWRETARFLRLDMNSQGLPRSDDGAKRAVDRLVEQGRLRPVMYTRERLYWPEEVRRFLRDETEKYGAM